MRALAMDALCGSAQVAQPLRASLFLICEWVKAGEGPARRLSLTKANVCSVLGADFGGEFVTCKFPLPCSFVN